MTRLIGFETFDRQLKCPIGSTEWHYKTERRRGPTKQRGVPKMMTRTMVNAFLERRNAGAASFGGVTPTEDASQR